MKNGSPCGCLFYFRAMDLACEALRPFGRRGAVERVERTSRNVDVEMPRRFDERFERRVPIERCRARLLAQFFTGIVVDDVHVQISRCGHTEALLQIDL